jgi:hypothetical protein
MNWIDVRKYLPGTDVRNIIVDGSAIVILDPKHKFHNMSEHFGTCKTRPIVISVKFYCLVRDPYLYNLHDDYDISLEGAIFYEIEEYCCTGDEEFESHNKHAQSIGLYPETLINFVDIKEELKAPFGMITRWAFINDNNAVLK